MSMKKKQPVRYFTLVFGLPALVGAASLHHWMGWNLLAAWLVGINAMTFLMWSWDKLKSRTGGWRVPEFTLHLFSALGGVPAAFAAMSLLRHKTMKKSFAVLYTVIFLVQLASWLHFRGQA